MCMWHGIVVNADSTSKHTFTSFFHWLDFINSSNPKSAIHQTINSSCLAFNNIVIKTKNYLMYSSTKEFGYSGSFLWKSTCCCPDRTTELRKDLLSIIGIEILFFKPKGTVLFLFNNRHTHNNVFILFSQVALDIKSDKNRLLQKIFFFLIDANK